MGRLVAQIPNEDPSRLARVQDAKWRTIGVNPARLMFAAAYRLRTAFLSLDTACPVCSATPGTQSVT